MMHITLLLLLLISITMQTSYSSNQNPEDIGIRKDWVVSVFSREQRLIYVPDNVLIEEAETKEGVEVVTTRVVVPIPVMLAPLLLADQITQRVIQPTQDQLKEIAEFLENDDEEGSPAQSIVSTAPVFRVNPEPISLPQATTTTAFPPLFTNDEFLRRGDSSRRREMPQVASDDYAYLRTQKKARFFNALKEFIGYVFGHSQS